MPRNPYLHAPAATADARLRLFCIPYAGGSAAAFRGWPARVGHHVEVIGIQLPGRGARIEEPPISDFQRLLNELGAAIDAATGHMPYALFGHSMGALLAFELCRRARRYGRRQPELLFVSGRGAPHCPSRRRPVSAMSDTEFLRELRELNGTPAAVLDNPELMEFLLPAIRADFELLDSWRHVHESAIDVPIVGLAGRCDDHAAVEHVVQWQHHSRVGFELLTYGGGHFFVHDEEASVVRDVGARLAPLLARERPRHETRAYRNEHA